MPCPARVNVLVVGTGGREHALAWKLRQSPRIGDLWVDPGANAGLLAFGRPCPETLDPQRRFFLQRWCEKAGIQLVVIGPDNRLAEGLTDDLQKVAGCTVFGPTRAAARIEWDKAWAKQLMRQVAVPCFSKLPWIWPAWTTHHSAGPLCRWPKVPLVSIGAGVAADALPRPPSHLLSAGLK